MTDADIKEALECCIKDDYDKGCMECPVHCYKGCDFHLAKFALNLINRKDAEIERLNSDLRVWKDIAHRETEYVEIAKAEAIKECLDWVLSLFPEDKNFTTISRFTVKQKLKEMVGDAE